MWLANGTVTTSCPSVRWRMGGSLSSSPTLKSSPLTFEELTKVALLGTERAPITSAADRGNETSLLAQLDSSKREAMLLAAAAVLSTYQRSGQTAAVSKITPPEVAA